MAQTGFDEKLFGDINIATLMMTAVIDRFNTMLKPIDSVQGSPVAVAGATLLLTRLDGSLLGNSASQ